MNFKSPEMMQAARDVLEASDGAFGRVVEWDDETDRVMRAEKLHRVRVSRDRAKDVQATLAWLQAQGLAVCHRCQREFKVKTGYRHICFECRGHDSKSARRRREKQKQRDLRWANKWTYDFVRAWRQIGEEVVVSAVMSNPWYGLNAQDNAATWATWFSGVHCGNAFAHSLR